MHRVVGALARMDLCEHSLVRMSECAPVAAHSYDSKHHSVKFQIFEQIKCHSTKTKFKFHLMKSFENVIPSLLQRVVGISTYESKHLYNAGHSYTSKHLNTVWEHSAVRMWECVPVAAHSHMSRHLNTLREHSHKCAYGVATVSRIDKIIRRSCRV